MRVEPASLRPEYAAYPRNAALDLVKWLAMLTMLLDHLRLLWPYMHSLFVPGRLAFPLFCLAIAANVARARPDQLFSSTNARYLTYMLVFALVSEAVYRPMSPAGTLNVMFTLLLGLLIAWGFHYRSVLSAGMTVGAAALAAWMDGPLMYGFLGCLLPAALLLAIKRPGPIWVLSAVLCVAVNTRSSLWARAMDVDAYSLTVLGSAFAAPLIGLWLLRMPIAIKVWPVGQWGYWFYPLHLALLQALRATL